VPLIVVGFQPSEEVLAHLGRLTVVLVVAVGPNGDGVILVEDKGLHRTDEIADDFGYGSGQIGTWKESAKGVLPPEPLEPLLVQVVEDVAEPDPLQDLHVDLILVGEEGVENLAELLFVLHGTDLLFWKIRCRPDQILCR
jgi:hypothetical protein